MSFVRSQKGMSMLGWMATIAVLVFIGSVAGKIFPHYMDNRTISELIQKVETDKAADVRSIPEFYEYVRKGMSINGIRGLDLEDVLEVKVENNEFRAHLKYERREPVYKNLDLVARFDKEFRVRMP